MGGLARPAGARPVTNQRSGSRPPIGRRHAPRRPAATRRAAAGSPGLPSDLRTYHMRRTCGTASRPRRSESLPTAASRLRPTRSCLPAPRCRLGGALRWRPRIHPACGKGARTGAGEHPRRALNASACPCGVAGVGRAPGSLFGRSFRRGCATSDDRRRQSEQNRRQDSFPEKSPDHFLGPLSLARCPWPAFLGPPRLLRTPLPSQRPQRRGSPDSKVCRQAVLAPFRVPVAARRRR